ncbi:MAG TPA: DNA recombination protein RmuC, partial [Bacteroidales bacterium]|nr:DNA recombination protein RmuC [Bacteroidales bacterium]
MEIILLITGIAAGALLGYLLVKSQLAANSVPKTELLALQNEYSTIKELQVRLQVEKDTMNDHVNELANKLKESENELRDKNDALNQLKINFSELHSKNEVFREKLETQKQEIENLGKKFKMEFENLANKILEEKSEKFTKTNRENIESLLKPLGENIKEFRTRVDEVYHKESKERFSLGERVKELAALNETISKEARELTKALRSESKTQGNWGEMILEKILELSGLRKGEEYFMEHQ